LGGPCDPAFSLARLATHDNSLAWFRWQLDDLFTGAAANSAFDFVF
jgi:hypothetical protein